MKRIPLCLLSAVVLCFLSSLAVAENNPYRDDVLWVINPDNDTWLYEVGEKASIEIAIYRHGIRQNGVEVNYEIGPDMLAADTRGSMLLGRAENATGELEPSKATKGIRVAATNQLRVGTMFEPGFRTVRMTASIAGRDYQHHVKLGFSPELLTAYTQTPSDFTQFWADQIADAQRVPFRFEKTLVEAFSDQNVDCYLIKLQAFKIGEFIYGYLTVPKREGKFPAVFSPPGAGIKPMTPNKDRFYAESGMIRFDMEIHGIRPDLEKQDYLEISAKFGKRNNSYLAKGIDSRDGYYMKKAYLSSLRVLDFLTRLPQWDGKNLIAQGTSQGGAIALVTAALDKRITAVASNHPALSDMAGYKGGRAGGYPHFFSPKFSPELANIDSAKTLKTLQYYDVVNFAPLIEVPVYMTWGFNDDVCPPTTSYIVYNAIQSPKEALITPVNEHWISLTTRHGIFDWIKQGLITEQHNEHASAQISN